MSAPGDERSSDPQAPSFLRALLREQMRVLTIRPMAPPALLARVGRWFAATFVRELAWQLSVLEGTVLAVLAALGAFKHTAWQVFGIVTAITLLVHLRHAISAHRSAAAVEQALDGLPESPGRQMPLSHLVIPPLMFIASHVERERGVVYKEIDGQRLRLDIYRPNEAPAGPLPALIQIHGGGWLAGSRFEQGIPLLNHVASLGWVGFNIDYRLSPQASWPEQINDVKSAIAWVRENAAELGVDPDRIAITGGSAGGHLCALAGVTENDPELQPGFEDSDTSVLAAVPFYGVYDLTDRGGHYYPELREWVLERIIFKQRLKDAPELYRRASPMHRVHPEVPPFMVIHGERDTLVPVGDARDFAAELQRVSKADVRYLEFAGAEHAFDLWPSVRTARAVDAIGRFLAAEVERAGGRGRVTAGSATA